MTNYADYPTTARFWQLVEELGIEGPKCDYYRHDPPTGTGIIMHGRRSFLESLKTHTTLPALDLNALLSWERLTKARGDYWFTLLVPDDDIPQLEVFHSDYDSKMSDRTLCGITSRSDRNFTQALAEYAIRLMEYERGEK